MDFLVTFVDPVGCVDDLLVHRTHEETDRSYEALVIFDFFEILPSVCDMMRVDPVDLNERAFGYGRNVGCVYRG